MEIYARVEVQRSLKRAKKQVDEGKVSHLRVQMRRYSTSNKSEKMQRVVSHRSFKTPSFMNIHHISIAGLLFMNVFCKFCYKS